MDPMIRFNNDYNRGAHPAILEALAATNNQAYGGYGLDQWCQKGAQAIQQHLDHPGAQVHFLVGGTQVNFTVIDAALRSFQSVICADTGHIHVHETGAVEHTGHKIQALPHKDGKITAAQIRAEAELYRQSGIQEHITQPKMVYLSYPTELGTLYSRRELEEIRAICREYGMYLFVDGARMGYGLAAGELTLADFARLCDAFYIGGTKCGALFGEALVLTHPALQENFRSCIKQNGGMLAKGWLLGLQFYTLFKDGLYFEITRRAVDYAQLLKAAFVAKGIPIYMDSPTNQQFVILTKEQQARLAEAFTFEFQEALADGRDVVRFCTAWSTDGQEIRQLMSAIEEL